MYVHHGDKFMGIVALHWRCRHGNRLWFNQYIYIRLYTYIYIYIYIIIVCTVPLVDRSLGGDCNHLFPSFPSKDAELTSKSTVWDGAGRFLSAHLRCTSLKFVLHVCWWWMLLKKITGCFLLRKCTFCLLGNYLWSILINRPFQVTLLPLGLRSQLLGLWVAFPNETTLARNPQLHWPGCRTVFPRCGKDDVSTIISTFPGYFLSMGVAVAGGSSCLVSRLM